MRRSGDNRVTHIGNKLEPLAISLPPLDEHWLVEGPVCSGWAYDVGTYQATEPKFIEDYLNFLSMTAGVDRFYSGCAGRLHARTTYISRQLFCTAIVGLAEHNADTIEATDATIAAVLRPSDAEKSNGYVALCVQDALTQRRPDMTDHFKIINGDAQDNWPLLQQPNTRIVFFDDWIGEGMQMGCRLERWNDWAPWLNSQTMQERAEINLVAVREDQLVGRLLRKSRSQEPPTSIIPPAVGYWLTPHVGDDFVGIPFGFHCAPDIGHFDHIQLLGRSLIHKGETRHLPMAAAIASPYHL